MIPFSDGDGSFKFSNRQIDIIVSSVLDLFHGDGYVLHQVFIAVTGNPELFSIHIPFVPLRYKYPVRW